MIVWFKQSVAQRNRKISEQREQISELQDALIEIAELVDNLTSEKAEGGDGNG